MTENSDAAQDVSAEAAFPQASAGVADVHPIGPDELGHWGVFGGRHVPEALMAVIEEVTATYEKLRTDSEFLTELDRLQRDYSGRPSPLYEAERLSGDAGAPPTRHDPLLGNGLALVGAWAAAIYFMLGRRLRARLHVMVYIWLVYSTAAIVLVIAVIVAGLPVGGFPADTYLWMALLGLVPQLVGHSALNFALGYFPAAYVSLVVLGEPIGSGLLAIVFLREWPVGVQLMGAVLVLAGVVVVIPLYCVATGITVDALGITNRARRSAG